MVSIFYIHWTIPRWVHSTPLSFSLFSKSS